MIVTPITTVQSDGRELGLRIGREYEVLGIEGDDYRLLEEEDHPHWPNQPFLYDPSCFQIVDAHEPEFWICKRGDEGERYCSPPEWSQPGFFERYHDRIAAVIDSFHRDLQRYYPRTWNERFSHQ